MGASSLPPMLDKIDLLGIFGLSVKDFKDENKHNTLRHHFLQKARECHPDKQVNKSTIEVNEFCILKTAYDFLSKDDNLEKYLENKQSQLYEFDYAKVDTVISAKQAELKAKLDKKLKEFKAKSEAHTKEQSHYIPKNNTLINYYNDILENKSINTPRDIDVNGEIRVVLTAFDKADETNLLVRSMHFLELFDGFGLVSVDPISNSNKDEIAKIIFNTTSNAVLAILYYRQHKSLFRNDLYSLVFTSNPIKSTNAANNAKRDVSVKEIQSSILEKFKKRATAKT